MYDPRYPYPPPPPPKPGFPVWAIVLLAVGGIAVVGGIGAVVVGLAVFGAVAESAKKDDPWTSASASTTTPTPPSTPPPATTLAANDDEPDEPANTTDTTDTSNTTDTSAKSGSSGVTPPPATTPTAGSSGGSGKWFCNATGWARVCGFANVCNNMMFSGIGSGSNQVSASMMAKNACEGSMRARGGFGTCMATCSVR